MQYQIRKVTPADLDAIRQVIASSELFPPDLLGGMIANYLDGNENKELWFTSDFEQRPIAVAYCAPERMTEGTYNLLLIAVHADFQGKGIGGKLMQYLEKQLRDRGARVLLVETSGLPEFSLTRAFYDKCGYNKEATIRDFYQEGEDKVVYWKRL